MKDRLDLQTLIEGEFKIGIIGLGVENKSFLKWLIDGVKIDPTRVYLADRINPDLDYPIESFGKVFFGENNLEICDSDVSHLFKAPGIWSLRPEFEAFREKHGQQSIHSSLVFFFQAYREQIIGVTGTKGKSTTSSLIKYLIDHEAFQKEYVKQFNVPPRVIYTGNTTNTSPYDYWADITNPINPHQYYVLELSSFQLQDLDFDALSPARSVITNYYIDHQDQHGSIEEYWNAKNTIFRHQLATDTLVLTDQVIDKVEGFDFVQKVNWVTDETANTLVNRLKTNLLGKHNSINQTLALITALSILTPQVNSQEELVDYAKTFVLTNPLIFIDFVGLKHRLEVVAQTQVPLTLEFNGLTKKIHLQIRGINDSASTMPDATRAGIIALTQQPHQYLWLILTGKDKGGSVDELADTILDIQTKNQLYRIDYHGEIGSRILSTIYTKMGVTTDHPITHFKTSFEIEINNPQTIVIAFQTWLQSVIKEAEEIQNHELLERLSALESVDLFITLSPCGSSFDEFENAYQRGDWFRDVMSKGLNKLTL